MRSTTPTISCGFQTRLPDGVIFAAADVANSNQLTATMGPPATAPGPRQSCFAPMARLPTLRSCCRMSRAKQFA